MFLKIKIKIKVKMEPGKYLPPLPVHPKSNKKCCDYSYGYPPHFSPPNKPVDPDLVQRGFQDDPSVERVVEFLGRDYAHRKAYFHPSQRNCCVKPRVQKRK